MNQGEPPVDPNIKGNPSIGTHEHFVTPGIILFLDSLLVSIAGWIYWIVISKLTQASEIGIAVTVYNLVLLTATLAQMGMEYPLLKKSNIVHSPIIGTSLLIELVITVVSIPFLLIVINTVYDESIQQFTWLAFGLLFLLTLEYVLRFALLGILSPKTVLIIDLIGMGIKLPLGFLLVSNSYGALGMLFAYLLEALFVFSSSFYFVRKFFSLKIGDIEYFKEILKDAIVNAPVKWSKMIIVTLSIVLLALMGTAPSDIGVFYVALMITVVVASFATSMAYMVIPSSTNLKSDLSSSSLRISLSLTAPIVVVLLVIPTGILSLIGQEYVSAETVLVILAMTIIPSAITINMVSKLNHQGESRMLIFTGIAQIVTFLLSFLVLVPIYHTIGAAISMLIAYISSSLVTLISVDSHSFRSIIFVCASIVAGYITAVATTIAIGQEQVIISAIFSLAVTMIVIFASKNMTIKETKYLVKMILQRR